MRLVLAQFFSGKAAQLEAVGPPPFRQIVQDGQLLRAGGDHDLAAALVGNVVGLAEAVECLPPPGAVLRLEGAGAVVEAGVDHPAVVPGLVRGQLRLRLQQGQGIPPPPAQRQRRRQPHDASADDRNINLICHNSAPG